MPSLVELIEAQAALIRVQVLRGPDEASPLTIVDRQIAFLVEQITRLRALHKSQLSEIYELRFRLYSEIDHVSRYDSMRARDLKDRVFALNAERRAAIMHHEHDLMRLHERLFSVMGQRMVLY